MKRDTRTPKIGLIFLLAGCVLFGASLNDPFHFDDALILRDSNVSNPARWFHFLNPLHLRQLTFFTFYLNFLVGGDNPFGFHLVNLLLHIANATLLVHLLKRFVDPWIAVVAGAVFLVHPVQVESAVYIYQRSILLACFFSLLALLAFHKGRFLAASVLFFCAFESKESALAVPLAIGLLYVHRARKWLLAGAAAAGIATLGLLAYWNETTVGIRAFDKINPWSYLVAQLRVFYTYMRLLVWPYPQSLEYEFPAAPGAFQLALEVIGVLAIIAVGIWAYRKPQWRIPGLAALSFLILLAPTSSVIPSADAAFEHRLYLPMLGFALFASWLASKMSARSALIAPVLVILAVVAVQRAKVWGSDITLWEDAALKAPSKTRVWFNLGGATMATDPERARHAFSRALELEPDFPEVYYNLGLIEQNAGNHPSAAVYYQRALEQDDEYWPAWNNLGNVMFAIGRRDRALEHFERTLSLNPDYWPAQYNLAIIHMTNGRFEQAISRLRTVLDWSPDHQDARRLLALALNESGRRNAADEELKKLAASQSESGRMPPMIPAPARP